MKVTGFTIVRNAGEYAYPVCESIRSILPLCDEVVVAVGDSADGTRALIESIQDAKIKIIDTHWDLSLTKGGEVLAVETNKAFAAIGADTDWCVYIQADEVLHEKDIPAIQQAMKQYQHDKNVDGLLFKYLHFWGSYDYVGTSSRWYRHEIRVIKNDKSIYSYRDAQGFRKGNNKKLKVKPVDATVYHYGWVREPNAMQKKLNGVSSFWHGSNPEKKITSTYESKDFDYKGIDCLEKFTGSHPLVMQERIASMNWKFDYDLRYNNLSLKERFKNLAEKWIGFRPFDYRNYKIV